LPVVIVHVVPPPSVPAGPDAWASVNVVVAAAPAASVKVTLNGANWVAVAGALSVPP
jgi:hypothetical protein